MLPCHEPLVSFQFLIEGYWSVLFFEVCFRNDFKGAEHNTKKRQFSAKHGFSSSLESKYVYVDGADWYFKSNLDVMSPSSKPFKELNISSLSPAIGNLNQNKCWEYSMTEMAAFWLFDLWSCRRKQTLSLLFPIYFQEMLNWNT